MFQFPCLRAPEAHAALEGLNVDLAVMAYVLQFAPDSLVRIPKQGTIQYHPSLLPKYRGPSSINWPIIKGEKTTGLTIFRPNEGLDEGPIVLQKETPIGPDDTLGSVYFERLFPMGVQAMLEAADLVMAGKHKEIAQNEAVASYEGWCRAAEAKIAWATHVDFVYDLIRGTNPAPGAWTTLNGKKVQIFDARKHLFRTFGAVKGQAGRGLRGHRDERLRHRAGRADRSAQGEGRGRQERGGPRGGRRPGHHGRHAARHLIQSRRITESPREGAFSFWWPRARSPLVLPERPLVARVTRSRQKS